MAGHRLLQTLVKAGRTNPDITANGNDFAQALQTLDAQAETLRQNAKTSLTGASLALGALSQG